MNKIRAIHLTRSGYGVNEGKLTGTLEVENQWGEIKITIDPEQAGEIIRILAGALVRTAQETGRMMTWELGDQVKEQMEQPKEFKVGNEADDLPSLRS